MSYYVFGIGGTGARCMEAFVHLCAAGLLKDNLPVYLMNIDADVACGNLVKTQQTVKLYEQAKTVGFGKTGMFKNDIEYPELWNPVEDKAQTLDDVFQSTLLSSEKSKALGFLYESLFTKQERTTDLAKGFRGHPSIGAAVINKNMDTQSDSWRNLIAKMKNDPNARIFIFASVFGGTGAAGFPTIAKRLKKEIGNISGAYIGGALVLPYFEFQAPNSAQSNEMQAKMDEFMLNTKAALDYYDKSGIMGNVFKSVYMVGDSEFKLVKNFSLGSGTQKNEANYVEVYAALAAFDFFNKDSKTLDKFEYNTPMIGRSMDENNVVTWEDFPSYDGEHALKEKLAPFITTLYVYKQSVFSALDKIYHNPKVQKQHTWYKELVKKGGIDVYKEPQLFENQFSSLKKYADAFFEWINEIISNPKRKIILINERACKGESLQNLDAYQVVLPIIERSDKLTETSFFQLLCNEVDSTKAKNGTGADVLMETIYNICNKK